MMTLALLLSLSVSDAANPCPAVQWPGLQAPSVDGVPAFVLPRTCEPTKGAASLMYAGDIDPIEEVRSEERTDLDIYLPDETANPNQEI